MLPVIDGTPVNTVQQFSKISTSRQGQKILDDLNLAIDCHTCGTVAYYGRLFGVFLTKSLKNDFSTLLWSSVDPSSGTDGSILLHMICSHIHRNHTAFVNSIKNTIHLSTLSECKDDVQLYLWFIHDNLHLISSTGATDSSNNDLTPHILLQLQGTKIPILQKPLHWYWECMEGKLLQTPLKLLQMVDEESQILVT
jgi:hypothetical protein